MAVHSPRILSLCSGIGGLELGIGLVDPGARTVCYVEREAFAAACLVARMEDETLDSAPVWDNIKTFDGRPWRGKVSVIAGGYPCQPFSLSGKRRGLEDPRHLWPDIARIVREVSPATCLFENVPNHLNVGFREVCEDLWAMGFRVEAGVYSAEEVGAPHLRKRLFILAARSEEVVADAHGDGQCVQRISELSENRHPQPRNNTNGCGRTKLADSDSQGSQGRSGLDGTKKGRETEAALRHDTARCREGSLAGIFAHWRKRRIEWPVSPFPPGSTSENWKWMPKSLKPSVRRDADGISYRVDRLRALGNAVVPQVAAFAWTDLWRKMKS